MINQWSQADARNNFSDVVRKALEDGPQCVGYGKGRIVILSGETYDRLTGTKPGLKDFLTGPGPDFEGIDLSREPLASRDAGV
tara:strand:+ start:3453 stop:3701 length:249 start_codon:yes stop_codon:yes gene_type:complete